MIESYEIEFIGSKEIASILVDALKMDRREIKLKETENGFIVRINGGGKRITIDCTGNCWNNGGIGIVNSRKLPDGKVKVVNAYRIAEELNSIPEIALLGALAKLGVVDLAKLMAAIYRNFSSYNHVLAAKKGFESI